MFLLTTPNLVYGKAEGPGEKWHGHVTAITVGPEFRRYGVARKLMNLCELVSEKMCVHYYRSTGIRLYWLTLLYDSHNAYFVDLFVRKSNSVAINMYKTLGYSVYRTVTNYYSGEEDAFGTYWALREWLGTLSLTSVQTWGKHCRAMWTKSPSNHSTAQCHRMNSTRHYEVVE